LALLLGATYPEDVGAVVGYAPSSVVYAGNSLDPWTWNALYYRRRSSWTLGGRPLAFVDASPRPNDFVRWWSYPAPVWPFFGAWPAPRYRISLRRAYERPLDEDGASVRRAAIPVERIRGPVLLVSGADDGLWPSSRLSEMAMRRLQFGKHPYPYEHLLYEGAGHMIPMKGLEGAWAPGWLDVGGTREADLQAGADAWTRVVALLGDHLL
jgi:pimeloyl-ACP methyl ester carboxylesterase